MIPEFRRVVGQRFEPPSHTHGRYDVRDKSNFCTQFNAQKIFWSDFWSDFWNLFRFRIGVIVRVAVRVGVWFGKKSGFLTIPDLGLRASFAERYDARILSARTYSCTIKHFKQFFPRHSTQTLNQLKYPYPNPNQIEISLPKP